MAKAIDFGPVKKLLDDPEISEIMINSFDKIFVEKCGKKIPAESVFKNKEELGVLIDNIFTTYNKRIGEDYPYADLCIEDGTRINAIISPLSRFGSAVTFRKFSNKIKNLDDLVNLGMLNRKAADFLIACVKGKVNMILSGGTGVGKTTLLQMLSQFFAPDERVVTIEDAAELKINQANVVSLETRLPDREGKGEVTLRDLTKNALRMSPDRLIFGEIRGAEAVDMLQAMSMGNTGAIGIIHGNLPKEAMTRLESMVLMLGLNLSSLEIRKMISNTINLIVHVERLRDGQRRVTYITEVRGMKNEEIFFNDLFTLQTANVDGKTVTELKSAFQYYPLFFSRLEEEGLIAENAFTSY
ncbi:MAG TPA: ATPase, T2SS/T4P/T4SS family [Candidatus Omnitrophota bacterium]|nr:ATPase, T2SS/T4P/T4SS family [Candidatus Omnitrophota bacterium]HPT39589.1 ATPase, T2SS/T4P/T4SS family [Candidatus Omnitrophota bacterium]